MVETYVQQESQGLMTPGVELDQWNALVEAMGLDGQKKLVEVPQKGPVPFLFLNKAITAQFSVLCPTQMKIAKFDKTPIPIIILGLVKQAADALYFDHIEVWYDDQSPDPVVIGIKGDDHYLIGRWGDMDLPLDKVRETAKARFIREGKDHLKQRIADAQQKLANIETIAEQKVSGQYVWLG